MLSPNIQSSPNALDVTFRVRNPDVIWPWTSVPQDLAQQEAVLKAGRLGATCMERRILGQCGRCGRSTRVYFRTVRQRRRIFGGAYRRSRAIAAQWPPESKTLSRDGFPACGASIWEWISDPRENQASLEEEPDVYEARVPHHDEEGWATERGRPTQALPRQ